MTNRYNSPATATHQFTSQLDREWQALRRRRQSLRQAKTWVTDDSDDPLTPVLTELTDLEDLLAATRGARGRRGPDDKILLRLVEIAQDDQLAGRIVIQRLLPGLIARAAKYRSFHDMIDPAEIIVPAAWLALRSYNVQTRRHDVAASLLSDTTFFAFRQPLRRRAAAEEIRPPLAFLRTAAPPQSSTAIEELAAVIRDAQAAGVATYDIELIRHLVRSNSPAAVARERNVTPRTVRNHRTRAIDNVRKALSIQPAPSLTAVS